MRPGHISIGYTWIDSIQRLERRFLSVLLISSIADLGSGPVEHAFQRGPRGLLMVRNAGDEEAFEVL